jgi:hypothetical protein
MCCFPRAVCNTLGEVIVLDGGEAVVLVVEIVGDGVRPDDRMGGMRVTEAMTAAELAEYNRTKDTSDFDDGEEALVTVRRNVTISVRFSDTEIAELRARAEQAGVKVTSFIRAAALESTSPIDRAALGELVRDLERRAHDVAAMIGRGVA